MKSTTRNVCILLLAIILTSWSPSIFAADNPGSSMELESLLKRWAQVHMSNDRKADQEFARKFLADDYEIITGEGMVLGRDTILKSFEVGTPRSSNEILERKIRVNGDTAVVRELCKFALPEPGEFKTWTTMVLIKKEKEWKLCFSQVTVVR
jgi:hypothetical protein